MLANAKYTGSGILATILGVIALIVGATGLFTELQGALNTVWGVQPKSGRGMWGIVKDRALSFAMVLGSALLLLASLVVSTVLDQITEQLGGWPHPVLMGQVINFLVSFGVITLLFAMIYRFLPDVVIAWRDVWLGALVTSLLFAIGKYLIGLYLGHSAVASAYGAAGSLAMLLIWLYYSAQIFLFGAELTKAYANRFGRHIVPRENAELICPEKK
jgi:membrane protein